jgi:hypothetical protein
MTGVGASHDSPLRYDLVSDSGGWRLVQPFESEPDATVTMGADTAWRLFTKGISKPEAMDRATVEGDPSLGETVFDAVSIIA